MKLQLISDLHFEFFPLGYEPYNLLSDADVLVIAGDMTVGAQSTRFYLELFSKHYPNVIFVMGNHCAYGTSLEAFNEGMQNLPSNVHWLNPGTVRIGDITFIGASMWTDFRNNPIHEQIAAKFITDFKRIKGFSITKCKELFLEHTDYIQKAINSNEGRKVIITHFLPGQHCIHPRRRNNGYPTDQLNSYFAPVPRITLDPNVTHWLFGHTHDSIDVTLGAVRYLANPYGYHNYETNPNFNSELIL